MLLTIVAATPFEIQSLSNYLQQNFTSAGENLFLKNGLKIHLIITGVGLTHTAFALGRFFANNKPDLVINAGVGGTISSRFSLGEVVQITEERFADLGVEESNGEFTDIHEMGLIEHNSFPFQNGRLHNNQISEYSFLPLAKGISVQKVHGSKSSIAALLKKYPDAEIESMEGAAFFYACLMNETPFFEIRSISNYVEPRNKANWNLPLAIENLNKVLIEMVEIIEE